MHRALWIVLGGLACASQACLVRTPRPVLCYQNRDDCPASLTCNGTYAYLYIGCTVDADCQSTDSTRTLCIDQRCIHPGECVSPEFTRP